MPRIGVLLYFPFCGDTYLASHIEIFLIHCAAFHLEIHNLAGSFSRRAAGHLHGRCVRVCASVCGNFRECARVRKSRSVRMFVCTYMNLKFQIFGAIGFRSKGTSFVYVSMIRVQRYIELPILLSHIFPIECNYSNIKKAR